MSGKGSKPRPIPDREQFYRNWDAIQWGTLGDFVNASDEERGKVMAYYTPDMAGSGQRGICIKCKLPPTPEGHDGCLGTLPGNVMNACCGHGRDSQAYIQYWDAPDLRGADAVREQERLVNKEEVVG